MKTVAIILAAGEGARFGADRPKQFAVALGKPVLWHAISAFQSASSIDDIVLVVPRDELEYVREAFLSNSPFDKVGKVIAGGSARSDSARLGLAAIPISTEIIAIHDGVRPTVSPSDINRVVKTARAERVAILASPATSTIKRVASKYIINTIKREGLYLAETPQAFQADLIREAYQKLGEESSYTDDAQLVEALGFKVCIVESEFLNIKVTTREDIALVEAVLKARK